MATHYNVILNAFAAGLERHTALRHNSAGDYRMSETDPPLFDYAPAGASASGSSASGASTLAVPPPGVPPAAGGSPPNPAPPPHPPAPLSALQYDLLGKMEMEAALLASPEDAGLRARYFDLLAKFAGTRTGLSHALLPEIGHPLYFRCGSADVINLAQVFRDGRYDLVLRATPLRICDFGAYAGYAAVWLAHRYPDAQIVCVEPGEDNFRLLTLNTTPYRRIRALNTAVWHSTTRLGVARHLAGDQGLGLHDQVPETDRTVPVVSVGDLLLQVGWDQVDFVKCDIEGAEYVVFANPHQRWLRMLDAVAIQTHDTVIPGSAKAVAACFDPVLFDRQLHGEVELYQRRDPLRAIARMPPRALALIHSEPGLFPCALQDVARTAWGFFTFNGGSCQLHPNAPGERPARAVFPRTLAGQTRFETVLHHAGQPAGPIAFTLIVEREDGSEILRADRVLAPQAQQALGVDLPALVGRHRVILQTEMAPGAVNNFNAWARWIDPRLF